MIAYLTCYTGISGDKLLGALLDVGIQSGAFTAEDLQRLASSLAPETRVSVINALSGGMDAVGIRVEAASEPPHRHWRDIRALIDSADLPEPVRETSLAAFSALAEAEADVHGVAIEDVHFHEVGAIDSIVDIVGSCAAIHALEIERLIVSEVVTGWGTVDTSHGLLPVPTPATAKLLVGIPVQAGDGRNYAEPPGELTTPTGAALVRTLASSFGAAPPMTPRYAGYGAGTRELEYANICALLVGDAQPAPVTMTPEDVTLLETNVDHISPEALAFASEHLMAEGALDVWITPIVMKKGRAAATLSALAPNSEAEHFASRMASLTGSLGVRVTAQPRLVALRVVREIETPWGAVHVKVGAGRLRPEHEDIARVAIESHRDYQETARDLERIAAEQLDAE
jgi:uncharacterized protein (TIGR00299 family) protein